MPSHIGAPEAGAGFGFALGATSMFASAILTAGIGPWLPYQMLGASWVALGAGLLPWRRGLRWPAELSLLWGYTAFASLAYGFVLNMSFWPFSTTGDPGISPVPGALLATNLAHFVAFSLATSGARHHERRPRPGRRPARDDGAATRVAPGRVRGAGRVRRLGRHLLPLIA